MRPVKYRFTQWYPGLNYTLVKPTKKVFESLACIYDAFQKQQLSCDHLSEYCHVDDAIARGNRNEPRHTAVFQLRDGTLIQPQQSHYRQCYRNSGRTDRQRAHDMLSDETPYWCCVYLDRIQSEQKSKKKYTEQQKRKKRQRVV